MTFVVLKLSHFYFPSARSDNIVINHHHVDSSSVHCFYVLTNSFYVVFKGSLHWL